MLGYAYAANGEFAASHKAYSAALPHLRRTRFRSLKIYCRFNMARALAELGYTVEAAKNCEDALNMLTLDGKGDLPFAYASNTLALVYNAERTLDAAWPQAAVAHACFLRMSEARGVALAEMQFGETLRRLQQTGMIASGLHLTGKRPDTFTKSRNVCSGQPTIASSCTHPQPRRPASRRSCYRASLLAPEIRSAS